MNAIRKVVKYGGLRRLGLGLLSTMLLGLPISPVAYAVPKQIIILRHGEKADGYKLCPVGQQRSLALQANYLGKGAASSLFPIGSGPDAILAITLHTLELASPSAQSWSLPMQLYSVVPLPDMSKNDETLQLNLRTQQAAQDVLNNPNWNGKTIVMVWEHDHIAKKKLEKEFPNQKITLRQLLNLDQLPASMKVPESWEGDNYDYFWIIDYGTPNSTVPTGFSMQKQTFPKPYQHVPDNDWGKPEKLPQGNGCRP
jgi:hypothetical protein